MTTRKAKSRNNLIGVFDTETWGLDARPQAFAMGVCEWKQGQAIDRKIFFNREEMASFMIEKRFQGYTWYAHNAEYDLLVLYGNFLRLEDFSIPIYAGSRFILWEYLKHHKRIYFNDSMNLFQASLAQIGREIGLKKGDTPSKFINPGEDRTITEKDVEYCVRDVDIVMKAIDNFYDFCYDNWEIKTGCTIGQTSLRIFTTQYLKRDVMVSGNDKVFRNSYYGGRTEVLGGRKHKNLCYCYDFNSLYPACMINGVYPFPYNLLSVNNPKNNIITDYEGVSFVRVRVPDQWYPPLPYKLPKSKKLIFPVGEFNGWYNHNELRPRMFDGSVELLKIYRSIYSTKTWKPFREIINDLYNRRLKAKQSKEYVKSMYLKYLMNSLYGKFGQKKRIEEIGDMSETREKDWVFKFFHTNTNLGIWQKVDSDGKVIIEDSHRSIISLASYTTSYARMMLYDAVVKIIKNGGKVFYTDTDSIFTDMKMEESNDLGALKLEHYGYITPLAPKMYEFEELDINDEKELSIINRIIKVKGVSKPGAIAGSYEMRRIAKLKESNRRDLVSGSPMVYIKQISDNDSKREWTEDGESLPIRITDDYLKADVPPESINVIVTENEV